MLDCFTGIGGFHISGKALGINTITASEVDGFNCKHIDKNLRIDNAGDIRALGLSENTHPYMTQEDIVPAEQTGFSTYTFEDFMEGVAPWPDIITGGFPCQKVSPSNLLCHEGIKGQESSLYKELIRLIEAFEPKYAVFENSERLNQRGLCTILKELHQHGYHAQWETISASAFGYPHYRHRLYLVAYRSDSMVAKNQIDVFSECKKVAQSHLGLPFNMPLLNEDPSWYIKNAVIEDTRSIKLRTKRINALGNSVIPDIAKAILKVLKETEEGKIDSSTLSRKPSEDISNINDIANGSDEFIKLPTRGLLLNGNFYNTDVSRLLNPTKNTYTGMLSTLIRKDGNNNFTTRSRLARPGKLGGLVGDIMRAGATTGGLHPEFCEVFMGYPKGFTELN